MSRDSSRQSCLDAETLAAFAEGRLSREQIAPVLTHLRGCALCMADVDSLRARERRRFPLVPLAAAAAIAVIVTGVLFFRARFGNGERDPIQRLVSLAPQTARVIEPRLTGGFIWSPYAGPMRAGEGALDTERLKLAGAAGQILDDTKNDASPSSQRVAGIALVLVDRPLEALTRLRAAADAAPKDARTRSDLAAAEYAAAARLKRDSLYPAALADADLALRLEPRLAEALFNRALILERLGLSQAAREAWQRYLEADGSSPWANEARERLGRLPVTTTDAEFRTELPRLESAALAGDAAGVAALAGRYRQQSRAFGEGEYLGRWGEAELRGDTAEASRQLNVGRALGTALAQGTGESLLQAAVKAVDTASPPQRRALAEGHAAYRQGRMAYSRQSPAAAETDLRRAAGLFASVSPMALVARYYAANTRFDRNDVAGARSELETLLGETAANPRFAALNAHVRWELALCLMNDDDWSAALPLVRQSAEGFCRLGETSNCGFLQTLLADVLVTVGRPDDGWAARIRSFEMLSASGRGDRLPVSIGGAARMELRSGRMAVARSLLQLERAAQSGIGNDVIAANTLVRQAVLAAHLGDDAEAGAFAREAALTAGRITNPALRERTMADIHFAGGAAALRADARRAAELLGQAIDGYRAAQAPLFLAECYLLRARARLRLGDRAAARQDLDDGMAAYERHPVRFTEGVAGTGVLDAGSTLYSDAIALALAAGDTAGAFAYNERALAQIGPRTPAPVLEELQQRLRGSGAALLAMAVLPDELVTFCVGADRTEVRRQPIPDQKLSALADSAAGGDRAAASSLYDLLIRPFAPQFASARQVIVVPGPRLARVPFAALADSASGRLLVEQLPVSVAPAASALRPERRQGSPRSIVAVELASDDAGLPDSADELTDVRGFYPQGLSMAADDATLSGFLGQARSADVIHLSGHSSGEPAVAETEVLIGPPGKRERISWQRLSAATLEREPVVVLAACNTLRTPPAPSTRALSLGGAFLAAGAGDVIGTLEPIADHDARIFFRSVHQRLASGAGAVRAVREAQLESLRDPKRTAWRSVAVFTTRIPRL